MVGVRRFAFSGFAVRTRVSLIVIVVFGLLSGGHFLLRALYDYAKLERPGAIERYLGRFTSIKTALPPRGVVGYVAEDRGKESIHGGDYYRKFHLAQYALAPLIVVDNTAPVLVIGNFAEGSTPPRIPGLSLVRDYGNGVMLFRRAPE